MVLIIGGGFFFWQKKFQNGIELQNKKQNVTQNDCTKVDYPFACFLDRAMQVNDPGLCVNAGADKRMDCLKAYAEIRETGIDCSRILEPDFQLECQMATWPSKK